MLKILLQNLLGYDILIFLIGAINAILFSLIMKNLSIIEGDFKRTSYLQNEWLFSTISGKDTVDTIKNIRKVLDSFTARKSKLDSIATFYISITGIFPLLGILGTVISLLTIGDFTGNLAAISFSKALTSTFWGIVFGVMSKFGEGFFAAKLENYDKLYHEVRMGFIKAGTSDE